MPGYEVFGKEERRQIMDVLKTGVLFRYEFPNERKGIYKVKEFEEAFARYCGVAHAQAVSSGTAALKVAMAAIGIGAGDEVITQGFTFVATWEAILAIGAIPVFAEIDETLNMDPADLEKKITPRTRAIIPVHMLGAQARIEEIVAIARRHNLKVIEDTAQAAGGRINGKHVGAFGDMGTFSFDPVKTITTGEGGMVITNDADLYRRACEYHDHGHDHVPNSGGRGGEGRSFIGLNYRMMELQGAIGLAQLAKLDSIIARQKKNKARIKKALKKIKGITFRRLIDEAGDTATFLAFFLPDAEKARAFNAVLKENGAGAIYFAENTWHYYPKWEHLLAGSTLAANGWPFQHKEAGRDLKYRPDALPQSARIMERCLVYPIPVKMPKERLAQILGAIEKAAKVL
ncbi:MAG: DegT/DnrJ/EryC1/StrS family aminotransferase [Deltaproteobacteria bacterium]|nr:DegT/DnrJ/EryC1/StrS family aminotransferase [Deltaproteobacteria bacterium]